MAKVDNWVLQGIPYVMVLALAIAFLFIGNHIATEGMVVYDVDADASIFEARILRQIGVTDHYAFRDEWQIFTFEAEIITRGERRGEIFTFTQNTRGFFYERFGRIAADGDRIMVALLASGAWNFIDYVRIHNVVILGVVFIVLLVVFGRFKGFNSVLSMGLTCSVIFAVLVPAILSGRNIYIVSIIVCIYAIITTIFVINGVNKKSVSAVIGCFGGVLAAGLITLFMSHTMELVGLTHGESLNLLHLFDETPLDLNAIIFAGIIIGAVGAIMDMAVSVSSALWELKTQMPNATFSDIFKSGITIGKDILGSSINTLVLAYIGSSLTVLLFLLSHVHSLVRILNRELVLVELLQAIVGGFGIFLTMPLTALVCAALFVRRR